MDREDRELVMSETAKVRAEERAERDAEFREKRNAEREERKQVESYGSNQSGPATLGELSGLAALRQQMAAAEANQASKAEENVTTPVDVEGPTVDSTDDVKVPDVLSVPAGEVVADAYEDLDGEGDEYEDEDE